MEERGRQGVRERVTGRGAREGRSEGVTGRLSNVVETSGGGI